MQATDRKLTHYMQGRLKRFVIPVYQRNYDWSKEHCEQLFNDIIDIHVK